MGIIAKISSYILHSSSRTEGFTRVLEKVKITSAGWGECIAELKIGEEHTNERKILHNGMLMTMFDVITSFAMVSHPLYLLRYPPAKRSVSLSIHMKFFDEVNEGEEIVLKAKTVRCLKTVAFVEAIITNKSSGNLVAKGTQYFFVMA